MRMWSNRDSYLLLMRAQNASIATLKDSLAVSLKAKHLLLYDPAIALLGIYPKKLKTYVHQNNLLEIGRAHV